ncbi:exocyst complex component [Trifolium pratense]|uniref:Exocyst subunit Exo70 family protein n=1 Tax=Trifolium pratense TaxID=57577 RepID=A0A2K3LVJ2_TRIPR|nr:exocyst complex component [Trifolium pratense]
MQPKVWRFVGFASSVVGLLCYALSSSFNYLFGDWNLLKIFLYSGFSFIISLMVLFANIWQHSTSFRFKSHTAFLVLTITSLYSFFFDKVVTGKPDAYSLISCSSFAIMLLSLSRQNECGFEVDLFYFFLGCLIVQLMKIKLLLFILGAGFSYLLIILRSSFPSLDVARDNEFPGIEDENFVVIEGHLHSPQLASNNIGSMVENLSTCLKALQLENSNLIEILLEKLEEYLSDDSELAVFDPEFMINAFPPETIDNIHKTAKMMVSTGFEREFSDMYSRCRRECLVESLSRLWFQKLSFEGLQMLSWKEMEDNIKRWIKVFKVTLNILLPTERQLCDQVFFGFSAAADLSFTDVCMESTLQLLSFTKAMAIIRRSHEPEQLFRVLELFETMRDIIPEFKSLFRDQYSGSLQNEVATIWKRLGEGIKGIFMELENLIRYDAAQSAILSGGIHPITRYVMNHLRAASRSRKTLEQVFEDRVNSSFSLSVQIGTFFYISKTVNWEAF